MDDEINLRDYINVLLKRKKIIITCALSFALVALLFSFLMKPVYKAETTLLISSKSSGPGLSQFAGLASMFGYSMGNDNIGNLTSILGSKSVAEKVLNDLNLKDRIEEWQNNAN